VRLSVERYVSGRLARGEITAATARQLRWRLSTLVRTAPELPVAALRREHILAWEATIGWQRPASRRAYLSTVKVFCRWCIDEELLDVDPTARLARVRESRRVPRALNDAQMARLSLVLPDHRARAIVALMGRLGLRCGEVAALCVEDWDTAAGAVLIRGKGGHERLVAVPDDVERALRRHLRGRTSGPVVDGKAATLSRQVAFWMDVAGLKSGPHDGMSAHALRHTAASNAFDRSKDVRVVQELLGHANLATTDRYLRRANLDQQRAALGA
jgi:integrase/recombinase XerC/integrase/recombinase XerD